jgi:hypothetical protein
VKDAVHYRRYIVLVILVRRVRKYVGTTLRTPKCTKQI